MNLQTVTETHVIPDDTHNTQELARVRSGNDYRRRVGAQQPAPGPYQAPADVSGRSATTN
jgi:hypothetical protein